jgi:hypothetical protein
MPNIIIIQFKSIRYYLCAESTAKGPITDTQHSLDTSNYIIYNQNYRQALVEGKKLRRIIITAIIAHYRK